MQVVKSRLNLQIYILFLNRRKIEFSSKVEVQICILQYPGDCIWILSAEYIFKLVVFQGKVRQTE